MKKFVSSTLVVLAAVVGVWLWKSLPQAPAPATQPAVSTFPALDARGRAGEFVGLWRSVAEYEKATGKKLGAYKQSPMLGKAVAEGKLPPVAQRVGDEPLVVYPLESIGRYGSTLNVLGAYGLFSTARIFAHDRDYRSVCPDLAKSWRYENGGKTMVVTLRRGLKWSDGLPFTTDDVMFAYEHILLNKKLTTEFPRDLTADGKPVTIVRDDADPKYTFRIIAAAPIPLMELYLAHWKGMQGWVYECAHYMKQFHPDFVGEDTADRLARAEGFLGWVDYFRARQHSPEGPNTERGIGCPTMGPWVPVSYSSTQDVLERNPYYWKVDPDGNQLPYIDRMVITKNLTGEVAKLKIMSGGVDLDLGLNLALADGPTLMQYQPRGGYRALVWTSLWGSVARYSLNLDPVDLSPGAGTATQPAYDPVKKKIFNDLRFRQALSLAIDRNEINDNLFFGNAKPVQASVVPLPQYSRYYEESFGRSFAQYDPARANALLDEMGLTARDGDGYRLRPDGKPLTILLYHRSGWDDRVGIVELTQEYWKAVGIRMQIETLDGAALYSVFRTGKYDMSYWHMDGVCDVRFPTMPYHFVPMDMRVIWGPTWANCYLGRKPMPADTPQAVRDLFDAYRRMEQALTEAERVKCGREILRSQAENLWGIGTVSAPPVIFIANSRLRNVPEHAFLAWDTFYTAPLPPEAIWFDDSKGVR
ncbi:MAG: ABC transporter substrate-binding protein [Phycisphaerae bacterium]